MELVSQSKDNIKSRNVFSIQPPDKLGVDKSRQTFDFLLYELFGAPLVLFSN
ncbi:uncharacterized protein BO96DRAFT_402669 [Aspergillus niger CBS 101883]|uniref:Uncharacterized protein n=2 Tax=Aspergillus niger TaxID=5061 RepID=A2QA73_ASPNC|nr:uncharacterized protein BO96DRAFT_402669 [Aspergillus niger CBS 101883]XP_059599755.1 hypothetical protein An01g10440 [Aspergillus niger]PYH52100.1 hypothetical protein BO96DRAFT_402669 [Aspergillus niger CBS 101883]CAK37225.1 hypothetical protein An01g10440 [Aspergillus niger]